MVSEQQAAKELVVRNWSFAYFGALDKIDAGLKKLGISPHQVTDLIEATNELKDSDFRATAFALLELKKRTGKSSKEAETYIKGLDSQITSKEKQMSDWTAKIEKTKGEFRDWEQKRKGEKAKFESEKARYKSILKEDEAKLNQQLSLNNEVRENIEETISLKAELKKVGLDLAAFKSTVAEAVQKAGIGLYIGKKIVEAVKKFGSLEKAIAEREKEEKARRQVILNLFADEKEKREILRSLEGQITARHQTIEEHNKKIESKIRELEWCNEAVDKHKWQYQFFELFISMLSTSPSASGNLAAVGLKFQELSKKGWTHSTQLTSAQHRAAFITLVMGTYLRSIRCGRCRTSFIVNKAYNSYSLFRTSYYCPVCGSNNHSKPDETFFNLMVSSDLAKKFQYSTNILELMEKTDSMKVLVHWLNLLHSLSKEVHKALSEGHKIEVKVVDGSN